METLAVILIIFLLLVEVYCGTWLYSYFKRRSQERAEARRAATRPRIYKEVHDKWEIERNRRKLWSSIEK
ncbi:hypothetical protein [Ruminococcus sp.]|uniref:hypothetical protein n=1 Tax=Ruminococcus sp. TaxID=41978 RepID=UPI001B481D2A|nr:hypothetical protein [Ruminococcus sp.]MBP5430799.1 hypothetical protein [Ruminococcus sp.]